MKRLVNGNVVPLINGSRPLIKPGRVSPKMNLTAERYPQILRPHYADTGVDANSGQRPSIFELDSDKLSRMRDACKHAAELLQYAGSLVKPGVTTDEIDCKVFEYITGKGIYPSPLNYRGFPKSLCTSVNEVLCHGVPDDRKLVDGDIVNLDVSTYVKGFHGDTSSTFRVGEVTDIADNLCRTVENCLYECIDSVGPGVCLSVIGEICTKSSEAAGFESSDIFCGHGIGEVFHMAPLIYHSKYVHQDDIELVKGQVFTIEPIFCEGSSLFHQFDDGWTVAALDGGLTAQFEHTVLITDNGAEILTRV